MKLCFECPEYPPGLHGGIGTLVQVLARGLVKAGHQVRVVGIYPSSHPGPDREDDQGVQVWRLRLPSHPFGWVAARRRLFQLVRTWCQSGDVELIDVPDWRGPAAGWPALSVPVVVRLSGSASYFSREMGRRSPIAEFMLERASLRRGDFICSNSRYIGERTLEVFRLRSSSPSVIYPPVNMAELQPGIERNPHMVVFAGTLSEKKGVISLIKAWPKVNKAFPKASLHIWGKDGSAEVGGSMRRYLQSLLSASVLPSYAEGFALTPLHAMAAGCPTIYSTRGSGPELIIDGETGLLVDPDRPDEIAKAILTVLQNSDLAGRIGESGRNLVEQRFSWSALRAANEEFYQDCLKQFGHRSKAANERVLLVN
jgi:glycogen synthase